MEIFCIYFLVRICKVWIHRGASLHTFCFFLVYPNYGEYFCYPINLNDSKIISLCFDSNCGQTQFSSSFWDFYCPSQIPGNTGCIARTCAASAVGLHLVGVDIPGLSLIAIAIFFFFCKQDDIIVPYYPFVKKFATPLLIHMLLFFSAIRISGGWYKIKACRIGLLAVSIYKYPILIFQKLFDDMVARKHIFVCILVEDGIIFSPLESCLFQKGYATTLLYCLSLPKPNSTF